MTNAEQYTIRNQSPPFNLTDTDRVILAQTDEEFEPHSWEELKEIVSTQPSVLWHDSGRNPKR